METRCLIHYVDGNTNISEWNTPTSSLDFGHKSISSIQLQTKEKKLYTLSSKKGQNATFWQRDTYEKKEIISRSILKRLARNIWIELNLNLKTAKNTINIIKEDIKIK